MRTATGGSNDMATTEKPGIRPPSLEDFPAILEISNWATCHTTANFKTKPETLDEWISLWKGAQTQYPWFVAESNGALVGFAMASPFKGRCGYAYTAEVTVYIHSDHHGKGVGKSLYGQLIPTLKVQGFETLIAIIAVPNPASERLHARFNFLRVGMLERVGWKFGRWHDVTYWQLILNDRPNDPPVIRAACEARVIPEPNP